MPEQKSLQYGAHDDDDDDWTAREPPSLTGITDIELDTETNGLKWHDGDLPVGISIRIPNGDCQYLPWGHTSGNLDESTVKRWAERELRGKHITFMNAKFDIHMLREWGIDLEAQDNTVADVSHYAALLDDARRYFNLERLSQDFLGFGKHDVDMSRGAHIYGAREVADYACQDVNLLGELKKVMIPQLIEQNLMEVVALENSIIFPVCEMEKNGAPLDLEKLDRWCIESDKCVQELFWEVYKETGHRVDVGKRDDLMRLFYHLGIHNPHETKTGLMSFDDGVLSSFDHPIIAKVRQAKKFLSLRAKFLKTYKKVVSPTGILRYGLHQLRTGEGGTVTGRFSSSGGSDGVNIQQVSSVEKQIAAYGDKFIIRELFVPRDPKNLWLSADASQIEFRLFAHFSKSKTILAAYVSNPETDFHGIVRDMIKPLKPEITRKRAKDVNFARIYSAGKDKIATMLKLSVRETQALLKIYDEAFPEGKALLYGASDLARTQGYVTTLLGRRARFPEQEFLHAALNREIQGSAADIAKKKIAELHAERKRTGFIMRFVVHDEFDGDIPDKASADMVSEILNRQSYKLRVPILWEIGMGKNWRVANE